MDVIPSITLGPLLGIEDDYLYTVSFLSRDDLSLNDLYLKLKFPSEELDSNHKCNFKEKLASHYFYKFTFSVSKLVESYEISYSIFVGSNYIKNHQNNSQWSFHIPGNDTVPKIGYASCNGDTKTLFEKEMPCDHFQMWERLFNEHKKLNYSFHCLLLAGDQIYADGIWKEVNYFEENDLLGKSIFSLEGHEAINNHVIKDKKKLKLELESFYEELYIDSWSDIYITNVLSSVPSIMMWDDHDIFDGWGSHPKDLQSSELFKLIYEVARKYFEIFQIRGGNNQALISKRTSVDEKYYHSLRLNFRNYEILALDNRSQRNEDQIMSNEQYRDLNDILNQGMFHYSKSSEVLNDNRVILFVIPVPVAHLDYTKRTEKWLRRFEKLGTLFSKRDFRDTYNDDGLDHWDHAKHEKEQEKLLDLLFSFGKKYEPDYAHIISGDVHSAGTSQIDLGEYRIYQIVSSAIIHKPATKFQQMILDLITTDINRLKDYKLELFEFSYNETPVQPKTIYERNYGYLYKADRGGIKMYLQLENSRDKYIYRQPRKFYKEKESY